MTPILDWLFEYLLLAGIISLLILMYLGFFQLAPLFRKRSRYRFIVALLIFLPFGALWGALFSGRFGYAHNPRDLCISGKALCFLDSFTRRSRTGTYEDQRMYIVDPETGKKIVRFYAGNDCHLLAVSDGKVLYSSDDDYIVWDAQANTAVKTYSAKTLPALFPKLSAGVSKVLFEDGRFGKAGKLLNVLCKNGDTYFIDPFTGQLADSAFHVTSRKVTPREFFRSVSISGADDSTAKKIGFKPKAGSVGDVLSTYENGTRTNDPENKTYLYPEFVSAFSAAGVLVIRSYETTDQAGFLLTGVSFDMKQLWQISQEELEGKEKVTNKIRECVQYKDNLIFNLDHVFYSVNVKTGKVNWTSGL